MFEGERQTERKRERKRSFGAPDSSRVLTSVPVGGILEKFAGSHLVRQQQPPPHIPLPSIPTPSLLSLLPPPCTVPTAAVAMWTSEPVAVKKKRDSWCGVAMETVIWGPLEDDHMGGADVWANLVMCLTPGLTHCSLGFMQCSYSLSCPTPLCC